MAYGDRIDQASSKVKPATHEIAGVKAEDGGAVGAAMTNDTPHHSFWSLERHEEGDEAEHLRLPLVFAI